MFSRLGTERAFGGNDAARAVSAQSSGIVDRDPYLGQAAPCFQAAAHWCRGVTVLDKYNRPMKECAMQRRGRCDRPHDQESCRRLWTQNSERGARFRQQLEDYVKVVEKNDMQEPSREQLLDAGVLPDWNVKKQKNKDHSEADMLWRAQWQIDMARQETKAE